MQTTALPRQALSHRRHDAAAMQGLLLLCDAMLWLLAAWLPDYTLGLLLLCDLLLLSPLKTGRAFYFETRAADPTAARPALVLRYYRHGYTKAVGWRVLLWSCRTALYILLTGPALLLLTFTGHPLTVACGMLWIVAAVVVAELMLLRLLPVPYLLSRVGTLAEAATLSLGITRRRSGALLRPVVPFTPQAYHTHAVTVHELLRKFRRGNTAHGLQRRKKYDKMSR